MCPLIRCDVADHDRAAERQKPQQKVGWLKKAETIHCKGPEPSKGQAQANTVDLAVFQPGYNAKPQAQKATDDADKTHDAGEHMFNRHGPGPWLS